MTDNIKLEALKERFREINYAIQDEIVLELRRIKRPITADDLDEKPFPFSDGKNFIRLYLNDDDLAILECKEENLREALCTHIGAGRIPHWKLFRLIGIMQEQPDDPHQLYQLRGVKGRKDLYVSINDLIPLPTKTNYCYEQRCRWLNYSHYEPDWSQPMGKEWDELYAAQENKAVDLFKVRGTNVVVMPGDYLYTTTFRPDDPIFLKNEDKSIH